MTTLAAAVGRTLADNGVRHAFGVVGGGNILATAALVAGGVRYISARHEGGAVAMADAYHRATGEVAVCTTSHGPGLTNVATGLAEAVKHGSAMLVLCGDAPVQGLRPNDIDQAAFAATLGAAVVRITDPARAVAATAEALRLARVGGRPVVLCLPNDLLGAEIPDGVGAHLDAAGQLGAEPAGLADAAAGALLAELQPALDALAGARRPLLLAGLGAWRSGAAKALVDLGDRLGALLTTTVMGNGMFAGNPWSLGICGGFASPAAAALIREADVIVAFGASLDTFTLHGGRLIDPAAVVVQVDVAGTPTSARVDIGISGDASVIATTLLDAVNARGLPASAWRTEAAGRLGSVGWENEPYDDAGTADRIDPRTLSLALAELLPVERTVVLDGGHFIGWPSMYWPVPDPAALVFMGSAFQTIGLGFAGAVGAVTGRTDRTTVVALGDGGALMGLPELETLVRTAESALVVIYDDAAYGFEAHLYGPQGAEPSTVEFDDTDFAGVARSFGAAAVTVRGVDDLQVVRDWRDGGCRGTLVLDCKVVRGVIGQFLADLIAGH